MDGPAAGLPVRAGDGETMAIRCDGCDALRPPGELAYLYDLGHEVRYCPDCHAEWQRFEVTQHAEVARLSRLLALWMCEARAALALKVTPLDLPPVLRRPDGTPIVLG